MNRKTYYWCDDHKAWAMHHLNQCKWRLDRIKSKPAENVVVSDPISDTPVDSEVVAHQSVMIREER